MYTKSVHTPLVVSLTVLLFFLSACAQGQAEALPPENRYGETICVQCNMIISDERFATGYAHEIEPERYESIAFDDIGDMLEHAAAHPQHTVVEWYVHDFYSKEWLDATQAHYMFSDNLTTPMAQGTAAFAELAAAETMATEMDGVIMDWEGLRERFGAGELVVHAHAPEEGAMAEGMDDDGHEHDMQESATLHSEDATIQIIAPSDGAVVSHMLTVQIATNNFDLMAPGNHWHIFIDDELAQMVGASDTVIIHDVEAGEHTVRVTMSNAQYEDIAAVHEITVLVEDGMDHDVDHDVAHDAMAEAEAMDEDQNPEGEAAHDHDEDMDHHHDTAMAEQILGEAEVEGYQVALVSHTPLRTGYNVVMLHLSNPEGIAVSDAEISYSPLMDMVEGMDHGAAVEQPYMEFPGMYHGAIAFPMPSGPDLGSWTLTVSFTDPATSIKGEATFDIDVTSSKLSGSFLAPDESKIFLMVVQPLVPAVGAQPFEIYAIQKASAMAWPPVDDLELEITPWMPTMDHGSPNNENPVSTGDGHYLGQVNFSMAGPWTVTAVAGKDGEIWGEVIFEYTIP